MFSKRQSGQSGSSDFHADAGNDMKSTDMKSESTMIVHSGAASSQTGTLLMATSDSAPDDLTIKGNITTSGDVRIEGGTIEGDIRAHILTTGEKATIRGEIVADDIVINGHVIGHVRGLKIRLTSTARVEGDITHAVLAVETGARFEGSVKCEEDPMGDGSAIPKALAGPATDPKAEDDGAPAESDAKDFR